MNLYKRNLYMEFSACSSWPYLGFDFFEWDHFYARPLPSLLPEHYPSLLPSHMLQKLFEQIKTICMYILSAVKEFRIKLRETWKITHLMIYVDECMHSSCTHTHTHRYYLGSTTHNTSCLKLGIYSLYVNEYKHV